MQETIKNRTIFCRDNLDILLGIDTESIDLIYLDPPFNKKKQFTAPTGSSAEGASFSDIFRQEDVKEEWLETIKEDNVPLFELLEFARKAEGKTSYNFCYLAYMAIRLIELHRVLKDTGSIYLHCDPTMSHYLKLMLDCIFGEHQFRNEFVWCYKDGANSKKYYNKKHDILLFYTKTSSYIFNYEKVLRPLSPVTIKKYKYKDDKGYYRLMGRGIVNSPIRSQRDVPAQWEQTHPELVYRHYLKEGALPVDWIEIAPINQASKERTGYPTQKPLALLERIILASSNENDMVLDPFCGCATTCIAAEKLGRQWLGIDISVKAYELVKERLKTEVEHKDAMPLFHEDLVHFETSPPLRTDLGMSRQEQKFVYIISHPNFPGEYKVGIARNWQSRLGSYQTGDPERAFKMEYKKLTPQFRETEKYIHEKFENKHEWVKRSWKALYMRLRISKQISYCRLINKSGTATVPGACKFIPCHI